MNDKYCYENTDPNNYTQLVVSANLFKKSDTGYERLDLVRWKTTNYEGSAFKSYIANLLNKAGYKKDDSDFTSTDIDYVWNMASTSTDNVKIDGKPIEDYEAIAQLVSSIGSATFTLNGATSSKDAINDYLISTIGAFHYWNNGKTYYFTGIEQYRYTAVDPDEVLYGIMRNHKYVITVKSISGLGTPVPTDPEPTTPPTDPDDNPDDPTDEPKVPTDPEDDPDDDDPSDDDDPTDDPDKPIVPELPKDDEVSAIYTEIAILKYRVVSQDATLGGGVTE